MMRSRAKLLGLVLVVALAGCHSHLVTEYNAGSTALKRVTSPQGSTSYSVGLSGDQSTLRIKKVVVKREASPGFTCKDVDESLAKKLGATPFNGAYVTRLVSDSPAARAGLRVGDIIEAVGSEPVRSSAHLTALVRAHAPPDSELRLSVRRADVAETDRAPLLVAFTPETKDHEQQSTETRQLFGPGVEDRFTGMALANMPAEMAQEVFGAAASVVLISDVVIGSPAYRAGLRGGDRVLKADGKPCTSADDLYQEIVRAGITGERDAMELEVDGPGGPHTAALRIKDFGGSTRVDIPIVFDLDSSARETDWSLLLILLDYDGHYQRSPDRDTRSSWDFSLLFGLFGLERSPSRFELTLLWFIKFSSG
ncbi:MAG: PDZ domain-containing protein [Planctomycetota bacterium]